jgi:hypothetical protein
MSLLLILLLLTPLNPLNKLGQLPLLLKSLNGDLAILVDPSLIILTSTISTIST